jgi:simple sugar transport system substrate-binding protein
MGKPETPSPSVLPESSKGAPYSVLVFITGMLSGSPTYQMLADGANEYAASHPNVKVKVYEAGFNQADYQSQLTSLAASGQYQLVLGSNPALPEICAAVASQFPKLKFAITDSSLAGNPQIATWSYNQFEQSLALGYLAGLITNGSGMQYANADHKVGFIAAQEYPMLNKWMLPGFTAGAKMADPAIGVDYRVIGNWYDANKAANLADAMVKAGADVIISDAGGAAQGIIKSAEADGAYLLFLNDNEYATAPGYVAGCGEMQQKKLAEEILDKAVNGTLEYGTAKTLGFKEGYLDFIATDAQYQKLVPAAVQAKMADFVNKLKAGTLDIPTPEL